jgi:hypothetical protein
MALGSQALGQQQALGGLAGAVAWVVDNSRVSGSSAYTSPARAHTPLKHDQGSPLCSHGVGIGNVVGFDLAQCSRRPSCAHRARCAPKLQVG